MTLGANFRLIFVVDKLKFLDSPKGMVKSLLPRLYSMMDFGFIVNIGFVNVLAKIENGLNNLV